MAIGYMGRAMRQGSARRARSSAGWPIQCHGCGESVGASGSAPVELMPFGYNRIYSHRSEKCRGATTRRWLVERKLVTT